MIDFVRAAFGEHLTRGCNAARSFEIAGVGFWLLARNGLRLSVLLLPVGRNDQWTIEDLGIEGLPVVGSSSAPGCLGELPRAWMAATASPPNVLSSFWASGITTPKSRPSNPLVYAARHMEFMVRRCFFPMPCSPLRSLTLVMWPSC